MDSPRFRTTLVQLKQGWVPKHHDRLPIGVLTGTLPIMVEHFNPLN